MHIVHPPIPENQGGREITAGVWYVPGEMYLNPGRGVPGIVLLIRQGIREEPQIFWQTTFLGSLETPWIQML